MTRVLKLAAAAAAAAFTANAAPAYAAFAYTTFCESAGNPAIAFGAHPGRCDLGDVDVGNDVINFNAGSFGLNQGLIFQGYGDNGDDDSWTFTATTMWRGFMDLFAFSGIGPNTGLLVATLTDGVNSWDLGSLIAGQSFGTFAAGTYTLTVLAGKATNVYNYDLRVQEIPLPAGALLFGTALAGAAGLRRRRKTA